MNAIWRAAAAPAAVALQALLAAVFIFGICSTRSWSSIEQELARCSAATACHERATRYCCCCDSALAVTARYWVMRALPCSDTKRIVSATLKVYVMLQSSHSITLEHGVILLNYTTGIGLFKKLRVETVVRLRKIICICFRTSNNRIIFSCTSFYSICCYRLLQKHTIQHICC